MTGRGRSLVLALLVGVALVGGAGAAWADPAKPSNYASRVVDAPTDVGVEVGGGDSFLVLDVPDGTQVVVPGYDADEDFSDWEQLEQYLRVLPDGTVQLNRRSAAYYQNAARYGAAPEGRVGPDVPPQWETVADDGRVAWHDHRIHWMSPVPPDDIVAEGGVQDVSEYRVPVVVDGELAVVEGDLDWIPDRSPAPVLGAFVVAAVAAAALARRDRRLGGVLALLTGGTVTGVLMLATLGTAAGYDVATPPLVLAATGAVAPLLGATVRSLDDGRRRLLVALGGACLVVFGALATGLLDPLFGGSGTGEGGFGNWWLRPTLPVDVAPGLLRYAIVAGTGVGVALVVAEVTAALAVPGGLDGLEEPAGAQAAGGHEAPPGAQDG